MTPFALLQSAYSLGRVSYCILHSYYGRTNMTHWVPLTPQSVSFRFFTPSTISIQSPRQSQCPRCNQQPIQCALCPSQLLRGRIGVLLTGRAIVSCSDVSYVHCETLATVKTRNTGHLFLLAGRASYLDRQCEHSDPFILVVITSGRHTKRETIKAVFGGSRDSVC